MPLNGENLSGQIVVLITAVGLGLLAPRWLLRNLFGFTDSTPDNSSTRSVYGFAWLLGLMLALGVIGVGLVAVTSW